MYNWTKYGIDVPKIRGGKSFCPKCHDTRKHQQDRSLSVDMERGLFNCHNCGWSGAAFEFKKKEYVKPPARLQKVSDKVLEFFEGRGISNDTILRFGITESMEWMPQFEKEVSTICFNYYVNDELVNIKFRGPQKSFKMCKDAELVFYNINGIKDKTEVVIVEGEMDCLAMYEAGVYNCVSVPNGASKGNQRLEYLDNCWQWFEGAERIILATDGDDAGFQLRDELARRLGKERCYRIKYPEGCKDANEVLMNNGKESVKQMIQEATDWPIEGVITLDDVFEDVCHFYEEGYPSGADTGMTNFDELLKFSGGQLTMVTGMPGSGKSEFVDHLMVCLAKKHGWGWGVCSFETQPVALHVSRLMEKFSGKAFGFRKDPNDRINGNEFELSAYAVDQHFHFINVDETDISMEGILKTIEPLVKKKGIKGIVIDPWNYIEGGVTGIESETQTVNKTLGLLIHFLRKHDLHCFLIAHPAKMQKDKNGEYKAPTMYDISGSAHFFNKTHNGISVHRDKTSDIVDVYVQKVKFYWNGKLGFATYKYNTMTRQYYEF